VRRLAILATVIAGLGFYAGVAGGHGDEKGAEATEMDALALQPARVLAQQALAMLEVQGDDVEAAERIEAALVSEDQADVDLQVLAEAAEALEAGDLEAAVPLIDEALSRPLGAAEGKALHEAGREFQPGTGTQEVVGIIAGVALLGLGLFALAPRRRRAETG
jgi:MYXO-CTERM domain-containing protein